MIVNCDAGADECFSLFKFRAHTAINNQNVFIS